MNEEIKLEGRQKEGRPSLKLRRSRDALNATIVW